MADPIREGDDATALSYQIDEKTIATTKHCTFKNIAGQVVCKIVKALHSVE